MNLIMRLACLVGLAVAASGCAMNLEREDAANDQIRPVVKVVHSIEEGQAQYALGKYYLGQRRNGPALAAFTRAIAHDPNNPEARNGRAIVLVRIGDIKSAVRELETAVASHPTQVHLLNNLAYAYMLDGALILAAESLQSALALEPGNEKARENWAELSRLAASDPRLSEKMAKSPPAAPVIEFEKPESVPKVPSAPIAPIAPIAPQSRSVINIDFGIGLATAQPMTAHASLASLAVDVSEQAASWRPIVSGPAVMPLFATLGGASVNFLEHNASPGDAAEPLVTSVVAANAYQPGSGNVSSMKVEFHAVDGKSILAGIVPTELGATSGYNLNSVLIEVSNGNGIEKMAKVLSGALKRHKLRVWSISNAKSFDHAVTQIYFTEDKANEAKALSQMLPVAAELVVKPEALKGTSIRIIIGQDIRSHEMATDLAPIEMQRRV